MSDASLAEAEAVYRSELPGTAPVEFDIGPLDRVGLPAWSLYWSDPAHPDEAAGGIGYGLHRANAVVGALGEALERVLGIRRLRASALLDGTESQLLRTFGRDNVVDPRTLGLPAGTAYDVDRPLRWSPTRRVGDDAQVWVPAEFVASAPGDLPGAPPAAGWLIHPVTNGLGAGLTWQQAVAHAVGEILQRDGNGLAFRALDRGLVLDLTGCEDPTTIEALGRLAAAGVTTTVKLASTDDGVVNVFAVGSAADDGLIIATACGEAAHPDRDVAIRKAVLEFAAARSRKAFMHGPLAEIEAIAGPHYLPAILAHVDVDGDEQRVLDAMLAWTRMPEEQWRPLLDSTVFARHATVAYEDLPRPVTAPQPPLERVTAPLMDRGFEVLVADFPGEHGAHSVKVIVPGMEVETVAYARIGERNARRLLDAGRDDLVRVGTQPPGWSQVCLTEAAHERLGGPAWLDTRRLTTIVEGLLPLYREPGRHVLQLALAQGR